MAVTLSIVTILLIAFGDGSSFPTGGGCDANAAPSTSQTTRRSIGVSVKWDGTWCYFLNDRHSWIHNCKIIQFLSQFCSAIRQERVELEGKLAVTAARVQELEQVLDGQSSESVV